LSRAAGADSEGRDFAVNVDGKRAGDYGVTIQGRDDGILTITCQATVKVTVLGITAYKYSYSGMEVWKGHRLQRLETTCDDDGKQYAVAARAEGNGLVVRVNGEEHKTRGDVWLTSYLRLPEAPRRNQTLPLLDADSGRDLNGTLKGMGTEAISVAGASQSCSHYRMSVAGGNEVDLWYDAQERLVREEYVEDGHRVVYELVGLRH